MRTERVKEVEQIMRKSSESSAKLGTRAWETEQSLPYTRRGDRLAGIDSRRDSEGDEVSCQWSRNVGASVVGCAVDAGARVAVDVGGWVAGLPASRSGEEDGSHRFEVEVIREIREPP